MSPSRTGITESTSPRGVSLPLPPFRGGFFLSSCIDTNPGCLRPHPLPRLCRPGQPPSVVRPPAPLLPGRPPPVVLTPILLHAPVASRSATLSCANPAASVTAPSLAPGGTL